MGGGAADEGQARAAPRLEHGRQEMASLPIPDELMAEILLRLPTAADLARASAACVSFRRVATDRPFLRRYRKLHPPPLLGFLDEHKVFHPAEPPHPSAPAASAAALTADFSFSFLPAPARDWGVHDIRDGRVLLYRPCRRRPDVFEFEDMVVCDPLHRRYLLLPPITPDLAASVEDPPLWTKTRYLHDIFLVSPGGADEETSFRVVWMAQCKKRLVAFVFSSNTGQWRAIPSQRWSELFPGLPPVERTSLFYSREYVYSSFYWMIDYEEGSKLLVLDTETMEFSIAEPPTEARNYRDLVMVEAGEGRLGMFVLADYTDDLSYIIRKGHGGSSSQWHKVKTISLGFGTVFICNTDKYLLLHHRHRQSSLLEAGCFTLDIETFQLEKVCAIGSNICSLHAYSNFPPSLLSSPAISSGIQEDAEKPILEQDTEVLPAEACSHHDQNTSKASARGQAGVSSIGDGAV